MSFRAPRPLRSSDATAQFDCGEPSLDDWLRSRALKNEQTGASRTFVSLSADDDAVAGYYCLSASSLLLEDAGRGPSQHARSHPRHPDRSTRGRPSVRGTGSWSIAAAACRAQRHRGPCGSSARGRSSWMRSMTTPRAFYAKFRIHPHAPLEQAGDVPPGEGCRSDGPEPDQLIAPERSLRSLAAIAPRWDAGGMTDTAVHPNEPHGAWITGRLNWLRAGVLGANDGIVSVAAIVVGVAGATQDLAPILTAATAGLVGGAISMALGEYVSVSSQRDSQHALIAKERREPRRDAGDRAGRFSPASTRRKGSRPRPRNRSPRSSPPTTRSPPTSKPSWGSPRMRSSAHGRRPAHPPSHSSSARCCRCSRSCSS